MESKYNKVIREQERKKALEFKRAVAYARYSTENQRPMSIEAQLWEIKKFAEEEGYNIVKEYTDYARTGSDFCREEFQQMLEDSKSSFFDFVIVHKLDRFSRTKQDDLAEYMLEQNGVKVISVLEKFDDSPEGRFFKNQIKSTNQYYADNAKREGMKSLNFKASKNEFNGGRPPLGYDIEDKKYVINNREAEAVRMILKNLFKVTHISK